ncbi:MAG: hypothetical protein HZA58_07490 [Acidimicrobiia bacterium]|nr:hypothetical protein [Acidimicrobiia bacterium]
MRRLLHFAVSGLLVLAACGDDTSASTTTLPEGAVIAEFRTPDGNFKVLLTGAAADHARAAFEAGTQPGIPNGRILRGDGGVNFGHDWHLVEVEFAEMAIEVCDGTAAYIDSIGYDAWVAGAGDRYCPWGAELVALSEG